MFQNAGENSAKKLRARGTCTKTGHQGRDLLKNTSWSSPALQKKFTVGQILFVAFVDAARKTEDRSLAITGPLNTPSEELAP